MIIVSYGDFIFNGKWWSWVRYSNNRLVINKSTSISLNPNKFEKEPTLEEIQEVEKYYWTAIGTGIFNTTDISFENLVLIG
jgi:hypothetical protein